MNNNILEYHEVVAYMGEPHKKDNKHAYFQCPDCKDSGHDNLVYTFSNKLLKSWCCDSCNRIFTEILKRRKTLFTEEKPINHIVKSEKPEKTKDEVSKLRTYQQECNKALLENKKALNFLFKKRGITEYTVLFTGIGMDISKRYWVIPVYDVNTSIIGFEYRKSDFSEFVINDKSMKCIKEPGTYSCLAKINDKLPETEILIILEGFFDGYVFWQYLKEKGQNQFYHILTPSCGVAGVVNHLKEFDFSSYKKIILYLDSDKKGIKAMNEAKALFPFIEIITMPCGCKDFNEHYINCIRRSVA